jgi:uncharacterized protein (DUF1501 family)
MAIWRTARFDPEEFKGYGWLGRALDPSAGTMYSVGQDVPISLRGRRSSAVSFKRINEVLLSDATAARAGVGPETTDDLLGFVRRQAVAGHTAADRLATLNSTSGPTYPSTELAERLKQIAYLLKADVGARVFYTQQSGYDTHSQQKYPHAELLNNFADAVAAFFADMTESKLADQVALIAFSEFGRTIRENGSGGTDHGTAGAVLVVSPGAKGGVIGSMPSLTDLDKGEPKMTTDFRGVYAAALTTWLGLPSTEALGGRFEPAPLFRG